MTVNPTRKAWEQGSELEEDYWAVILALQGYFTHHDDSKQMNWFESIT
jgi:hypothetical protein